MGFSAAAAATIVGGAIQADAASQAAQSQANAGVMSQMMQREALAQQRALMEPFRAGGLEAFQRLQAGLSPGGEFTPQYALQQAAQQGMIGATPFTPTESPAQKFATAQALQKMQAQMGMGGQLLSSNAITGAGTLAADIASQYEQQAFNQWLQGRQQILGEQKATLSPLEWLAGQGQAAAAGQAGAVGQTAADIAATQQGIGNVQAAGQIGQAQGIGQIIGGGLGLAGQYFGRPAVTPPPQIPLTESGIGLQTSGGQTGILAGIGK